MTPEEAAIAFVEAVNSGSAENFGEWMPPDLVFIDSDGCSGFLSTHPSRASTSILTSPGRSDCFPPEPAAPTISTPAGPLPRLVA